MFREDNQGFMMTFETQKSESSDSYKDLPCLKTPKRLSIKKQKKMMYQQNNDFSWDNTPSINNAEQENTSLKMSIQLTQDKRINHLKSSQTLSKARKFSSAEPNFYFKGKSILKEEFVKSEKSQSNLSYQNMKINQACESKYDVPDVLQKNPPQLDNETYFLKKIKNLQIKMKALSLKQQNQILKIKTEGRQTKQKLEIYHKHLFDNYPAILQEIQKKITKLAEDRNDFSCLSDSSNSVDMDKMEKSLDDFSMPVFSQLQEVRFQGIKICGLLKSMSHTISQYEEIKKEKQIEKKQQTCKKVNNILRKWSIPYECARQKKQSFQTTINSAELREEQNSGNSSRVSKRSRQLSKLLYPLVNFPPPVIKQIQYTETQTNRFCSEKFIHIDNYEMENQQTLPKVESATLSNKKLKLSAKDDCSRCSKTKDFLQNMKTKLSKIPSIENFDKDIFNKKRQPIQG